MTNGATQELTLDTIIGPQPIRAPAPWQFDKTATIAWAKLLELTREGFNVQRSLRGRSVIEGQMTILANVLANSLGMAIPYWTHMAFEIVMDERKQ